ncbi:OmpA family protein [Thiosocius teredinicola]|uniref:OmpA family protein n=1 Tax=Thiosocius teredinicola TaxID=1973002 RepID=UPI00099135E9
MNTLSKHLIGAALTLITLSAAAAEDRQLPADPLADKVIVNGAVPDEASRAAIVGRLRSLYGVSNVIDQLEVGGVTPPPNWTNYVTGALTDNLTQVHEGQLNIDGTRVELLGSVDSEELRSKVATDIAAALNETYTVENALAVNGNSQTVLDDTLADRVVEFNVGKATLTNEGQQILDEIATAMDTLGNPQIQVIGHTDSTGNRLANIGLSLARADTVKAYLANKGIPETQMTALGAGPDHPITSNDTAEGRAKNRRIEFRIVK